MKDFFKRIAVLWGELSVTRKTVFVVMVSCLVLSSFLFYQWVTKVEYCPLFSNLQADDAGKIIEKLKDMGVPYRLADAGQSVMVPQDQVYELRLQLASDGVFAGGGIGFELFDRNSLGVTDFERQVNYLRALQEELRRTIVELEGVKQARVHLVIPERSVFIENTGKASASVVLSLQPLVKLEPAQVRGIAELVASSVENLNASDVTIIDLDGRILSQGLYEEPVYGVQQVRQMELKRDFEKQLETGVQALLERIYGPGTAVVRVFANLDFNQKEITRIIWGTEGVVSSEQVFERTESTTPSVTPVGDLNRDDLQPYINTATSNSSEIESIRNYELDRSEEREICAPGRLVSLSTAVVIDGELTEEQQAAVQQVVSAAVGFDPGRGDQVTVSSMRFDTAKLDEMRSEMAAAEEAQKKKEELEKRIAWGMKALGLIFAFILGIIFIRTIKSILRGPDTSFIESPIPVNQMEAEIDPYKAKERVITPEEKVQKIAEKDPEIAVQVVKAWLAEHGGEFTGPAK
ncbi:MAG: flagellar basal-body MS-ring/collar protein FliF [Syntrophomonadaceae bacterium]|jgi:flagellar M-ring protein FliF